MVERVLQLLSLSCKHKNTSQPFTAAQPQVRAASEWESVAKAGPGHYIVCLDCGRKFAYDWSKMRVLR